MSSAVTIFHNPRCSKSRQTMQLIESKGFSPEIVEYLKQPPDARQLEQLLDLLGLEPRELMRTNEAVYKELGLAEVTDDEALVRAMVENPILIQRPIVIKDGRAVIGRPPERVVSILE